MNFGFALGQKKKKRKKEKGKKRREERPGGEVEGRVQETGLAVEQDGAVEARRPFAVGRRRRFEVARRLDQLLLVALQCVPVQLVVQGVLLQSPKMHLKKTSPFLVDIVSIIRDEMAGTVPGHDMAGFPNWLTEPVLLRSGFNCASIGFLDWFLGQGLERFFGGFFFRPVD